MTKEERKFSQSLFARSLINGVTPEPMALNALDVAFEAGVQACKPKLHNLLENPNDLPDTNREVLVLLWDYNNYHIGRYEEKYDDVIRENTYWHFDDFSIEKDKLDTVLGWFELPKFEGGLNG